MPRTLVYAPNWLGDAVMAMPALQMWRKWNTGNTLSLLTRPPLAPLWKLHGAVDDLVILRPGLRGTLAAARALRSRHVDEALLLPNSFRSALIPWLAGIPRRRGFPRHGRSALLTELVAPRLSSKRHHQRWEYADILLGEGWWPGEGLPPPRLHLAQNDIRAACRAAGVPPGGLRIGIIPGAARGASKRWPFFGETAARLANDCEHLRFLVLGTASEAGLCHQVARTIGSQATCLAGKTTLPALAALLHTCKVVLCNDSGGMHLAAAVETPVVALYGLTDPEKTGPLGDGHVVIRKPGTDGRRAIGRTDREAEKVLRSIPPDRVLAAVRQSLRAPRSSAPAEEL